MSHEMSLRILVTGPRTMSGDADRVLVEDALIDVADEYAKELGTEGVTVIEGGATGADQLATRAAQLFGWEVEPHLAAWHAEVNGKMTLDRLAGFKRNQDMIDSYPDVCVAFIKPCDLKKCRRKRPHSTHGTGDCVDRAKRAGVPVREFFVT